MGKRRWWASMQTKYSETYMWNWKSITVHMYSLKCGMTYTWSCSRSVQRAVWTSHFLCHSKMIWASLAERSLPPITYPTLCISQVLHSNLNLQLSVQRNVTSVRSMLWWGPSVKPGLRDHIHTTLACGKAVHQSVFLMGRTDHQSNLPPACFYPGSHTAKSCSRKQLTSQICLEPINTVRASWIFKPGSKQGNWSSWGFKAYTVAQFTWMRRMGH